MKYKKLTFLIPSETQYSENIYDHNRVPKILINDNKWLKQGNVFVKNTSKTIKNIQFKTKGVLRYAEETVELSLVNEVYEKGFIRTYNAAFKAAAVKKIANRLQSS